MNHATDQVIERVLQSKCLSEKMLNQMNRL